MENMLNKITLGDSYELIKKLEDKSVDLILTDPPYGIGADKGIKTTYGTSTHLGKVYKGNWDNETPSKEMFDEILRVGKKVIIFGGNYFTDKLPVNGHWIVWDKVGNANFKNPFSDCELAWTNLPKKIVKKYTYIQQGFITDDKSERVHPTQKSLQLFKDIINDYTNENDIVLDCFSGSGTTSVACKELNRQFIAFEIDEEYHKISVDRLNGISVKDRKDKEKGIQNIFDFGVDI